MKNELEELGFEALYPMRSRVLRESVRRARNRREIIDSIQSEIEGRLREAGIESQVSSERTCSPSTTRWRKRAAIS